MSLVGDIVRAYVAPGKVMQMQLDRGIREPQTLFYSMLFGAMNLIANFPRIAATAPDQDTLTGMMSGLFIGYIFFMPLMLYGLAAFIHWVILKFGGQANWPEARRALSWSAVVTIPFVLLSGSVYNIYNNVLSEYLNAVIAVIFFWQLYTNFKKVEFY